MIKLLNIKKNDTGIECDILPEDSKKTGHIVVNEKEIVSYKLPEGYEWCVNHIHHARRALEQMLKENSVPDTKLLAWY